MRYFLLSALTKAFLAGGIGAAARVTGLVLFTGALHLLSASGPCAGIRAIDIAAITFTADHNLAIATDTEVKTGASDHRLLGRWMQRKCWIYTELIAILIRLCEGTMGAWHQRLTAKSQLVSCVFSSAVPIYLIPP
jgi:hypothetical protein